MSAFVRIVRSRPVRILSAIALSTVILSPAAVVGAVVWNGQADSAVAPQVVDDQPVRMLPPPDTGAVSLPLGPANVYANDMSTVVPCPLCYLPPRVYVPNSMAGTVDVIDPLTFRVVDHYRVGSIPHHITPSWDKSVLYVENEGSSSLTVRGSWASCRPCTRPAAPSRACG